MSELPFIPDEAEDRLLSTRNIARISGRKGHQRLVSGMREREGEMRGRER